MKHSYLHGGTVDGRRAAVAQDETSNSPARRTSPVATSTRVSSRWRSGALLRGGIGTDRAPTNEYMSLVAGELVKVPVKTSRDRGHWEQIGSEGHEVAIDSLTITRKTARPYGQPHWFLHETTLRVRRRTARWPAPRLPLASAEFDPGELLVKVELGEVAAPRSRTPPPPSPTRHLPSPTRRLPSPTRRLPNPTHAYRARHDANGPDTTPTEPAVVGAPSTITLTVVCPKCGETMTVTVAVSANRGVTWANESRYRGPGRSSGTSKSTFLDGSSRSNQKRVRAKLTRVGPCGSSSAATRAPRSARRAWHRTAQAPPPAGPGSPHHLHRRRLHRPYRRPSGKSKTRPMLSEEEVKRNAQTYVDQVGLILDVEECELRFNSEWFSEMGAGGLMELASHYTLARMLERDDFAKRMAPGPRYRSESCCIRWFRAMIRSPSRQISRWEGRIRPSTCWLVATSNGHTAWSPRS